MTEVLILILFALLATYLWTAVKAKEIAIQVGAHACDKKGLQFLDQTVAQRKVRPGFDQRRNPCWIREFYFEFATNGEFRYEGRIILQGHRPEHITLDPYPESGNDSEKFIN